MTTDIPNFYHSCQGKGTFATFFAASSHSAIGRKEVTQEDQCGGGHRSSSEISQGLQFDQYQNMARAPILKLIAHLIFIVFSPVRAREDLFCTLIRCFSSRVSQAHCRHLARQISERCQGHVSEGRILEQFTHTTPALTCERRDTIDLSLI